MSLVGDHNPTRVVIILLSASTFFVTLAINGLAGSGRGPFKQSTGNVSARYETEITPAGWTFSIWGLIYTWLLLMQMYILTWICRRSSAGWMYCYPVVLPNGFFLSWTINMILNITWLFLWDRQLMIPALLVLASLALTNYLLLFFSCTGLSLNGAWLTHNLPRDLWCIRVLVQNGIATYTTWTTIATLLNFTIVLDESGISKTNAATISLCLLLIEVLVWFGIENFVLEKNVRYILSIYPVVILALTGILTKNYNPADPSRNATISAVLLALTCVLLVARVVMVIWRHVRQPLHQGVATDDI